MNLYANNPKGLPLKIRKINKNKSDIKTHKEFMEAMTELAGSIEDPTFVEPQEIKHELSRDIIL